MTTTPPTTTLRPKDTVIDATGTSSSATANAQGPPEFVVTPATPNSPQHPGNTVAQTLPVPDNMQNTDTEVKAPESESVKATDKPITNTTTEKTSTPTAAASSSKHTTSTPRPASKTAPKKKKRSGLSGFLLKLGCLSADEFEDPEPKKGTAANKPAPVKPAITTPSKPAEKVVEGEAKQATTSPASGGAGHLAGASAAATGVTLVGAAVVGEKAIAGEEKQGDAVVVTPQEPTTAPVDETAGLTSSAVQAPGSGSELLATTARRQSDSSPSADAERTETSGGYSNISESEIPDESSGAAAVGVEGEEYGLEEEYEDEEDRLIAQGGIGIPVDENGNPAPLLPPMDAAHKGRKCLVLDLDETLLHSSFKMLPSADYIVPVEIESQTHNVYVIKRPGVDHFLTEMGKIYEVVIFTASLSKYADPVLDMLDVGRVVRHRLFRESCYNHKGNYVKDLSQLGRAMEDCIIIDNSPASYIFHPTNAVPVSTWFNDPHDTELTDLCPFLTDLATVDDIRGVLDGSI